LSFVVGYGEVIAKATLEQVNGALRKHFKLEDFQLVFVSEFK